MHDNQPQKLQDSFLKTLQSNRQTVNIFLINGIRLAGYIDQFDAFCVLLCGHNRQQQLVYKHAISTICPEAHPHGTPTPQPGK